MEIFSNFALRMNLAKGAKIRAKEHFSSMKMAEACLEKYNRIVGGNE